MDFGQDQPHRASTNLLCITCGYAGRERVARQGDAASRDGFGIVGHTLRRVADQRDDLSAAVRRDRGWTSTFGNLDGAMPWRERTHVLQRGLIAREPPSDHEDSE
jgi:hypothetical protein